MAIDLSRFVGVLPYDSQMFGIYQPLLGWKSAIQVDRLRRGLASVRQRYLGSLTQRFSPNYTIHSAISDAAKFDLDVATPTESLRPATIAGIDGLVTQAVMAAVNASDPASPATWEKFTGADFLQATLKKIQGPIKKEFLERLQQQARLMSTVSNRAGVPSSDAALGAILQRESLAAGVLAQLNKQRSFDQLRLILSPMPKRFVGLGPYLQQLDPAESDMARAALSPIGIVHLFREYFFEFATFLGTPVQHVWLSPGGTVELLEINTRKTTVERTIEQSFESIQKSEKDTTTEDELSDAVKQENSSDTKLGVSATSNTNYTVGFVSGSLSVTGNYNLDQQQKQAREQTHKTTRQQTQKLSSEIRQSYKSTFKTVTETTDTTSKRYVLQNTTDKLINYELRRKMRQIGVQVQDYGTRLCWQAYVDGPGDGLGVAEFVHVASLPDLQSIKSPDQVPAPEPIVRGDAVAVQLQWRQPDDPRYNFVPLSTPISIVAPSGYVYDHAEVAIQDGPRWLLRAWPGKPDEETILADPGSFTINADPDFRTEINRDAGLPEWSVRQVIIGVVPGPGGIKDDDQYDWTVQLTPIFRPTQLAVKTVQDTNQANLKTFTEEKKQAFQTSLFTSIRDRVKLASNIQPRDFGDLREEERILVYRKLVQQLLQVAGIHDEDPHVRHVFSELVESMFDMDTMLYFVAPDWWMPKQQVTSADLLSGLGLTDTAGQSAFTQGDAGSNLEADVVSWGGPRAVRPDNYFITEDSTPAKLGSSLGWLLQLDGDNFRNAFLNAPWVKAVIPIQEGHEWKALDWLSSSAIEGSDGLGPTDLYQETFPGERAGMIAEMKTYTSWPDPSLAGRYASLTPAEFTLLDAVRFVIVKIQAKQAAARAMMKDKDDPTLSYLPTDMVYEHGFDPLQGGFVADPQDKRSNGPFEVFDQWIEVLPTDQIVPVEVTYDPKTGLQK